MKNKIITTLSLAYLFFKNHFLSINVGPLALVSALFGQIRQSADTITFSKWKDKNVMKRKRGPNTTEPTAGQLANQRKFALLVALSRLLAPAINLGFQAYLASKTSFNNFVSFNYPFTSDNGTIASITEADIVVSKGSVTQPATFATSTGGTSGAIDITWDDNSNGTTALATDIMHIAYLNDDLDDSGYVITAVPRSTGAYILDVGAPGATANIYGFFVRADNSATSDNAYDQAVSGS